MRKLTAAALAICLIHLSIFKEIWAADLRSTKERVNELGTGARVKLKLATGEKVQGSIETISDEGFVLRSPEGRSHRQVTYSQVERLKLARLKYKSGDQSDPAEVRWVALGLGIGKHVMVKVTNGKKLRGHIQAIDGDHFSLLPDGERGLVDIPYADVTQLEKNLSTAAIILIVTAATIAVIIIVLGDKLPSGPPG